MNKFALKKIPEIKGRILFSMLEVDGACQFEEFCSEIEEDGNMKKQLITAFARMTQVSNLQRLPEQKFRDITPRNETIKEFEVKTNDLRIYLIKEEGHIIILGGKKNTQKGDISHFRSVKRRYLQSKKQNYA
jgi:putative component of toxin-antitoxin plasmid stabilization module